MKYTKIVLNEGTELKLHIGVDELQKEIDEAEGTNIITVFCASASDPNNGYIKIGKDIRLNLKRYLFFYEG